MKIQPPWSEEGYLPGFSTLVFYLLFSNADSTVDLNSLVQTTVGKTSKNHDAPREFPLKQNHSILPLVEIICQRHWLIMGQLLQISEMILLLLPHAKPAAAHCPIQNHSTLLHPLLVIHKHFRSLFIHLGHLQTRLRMRRRKEFGATWYHSMTRSSMRLF